jgi:anti-sigma B factor antagonist
MRIDTRVHQDVVTIHPKERISVETEAQFTKVVLALLDAGSRRLVLNLVDVPSIDSVGLGAIVQASISARCRGGDLKLLHVSDRNRRLLAITKLLTVLETYDTEADAERSFHAECEEAIGDPRR